MALQWQETGYHNSYLSLLTQTGIDISNLSAVTLKLFSKDIFNSVINISLAPESVPRNIYRMLQDSGVIQVKRTNETEKEGSFYFICPKDSVEVI